MEKKSNANTLVLEPPLLEPVQATENPDRVYSFMSWTLQVLGNITLHGAAKTLKPERRMVALLTYLALEGSTPRSKLAALLWPDSDDRTARNNLVQTLRRLKKATGTDLILGEDALKLSDALEVDIAKLYILSFQGNYQELLTMSGDLLPYDYDDASEFSDWLFLEREKLSNLRCEALSKLIERFEKENDYSTALNYATTLLQLDPINEETYRLLMRLHYLSGNRTEALKIFERCKTVLQTELGVEPLLETQQLAADIGIGLLEPQGLKPQKTMIPLSVLRPPVLVGREKAWQQLETAWQEGKVIFISGEPGIGKTRLVQDFMEDKGFHHFFAGRPGDESVPLSSQARAMRQIFERQPESRSPSVAEDLSPRLEPWIHTELSRLLPHLSEQAPAPMNSEHDKLRFYEAVAETVRRTGEAGSSAIVWDDFQYFDAASFEVGQYLMSRFISEKASAPLRSINIFRKGELPSQTFAAVEKMVAHDQAILIELQPLNEMQVETLLTELDLTGLETMSSALTRYTGGSPMFILETIKSLLESGQLNQGLPKPIPVSGKVATVIQKRLEALSTDALKLARVAAVAGADFMPALAESVLNADALELAESFAELERLQVLRGTAFAHDLIYEATLSGVPAPIKTLLHGRIAGWLEMSKATPARIAQHYLDADEEAKAVPFLLAAAEEAKRQYLFAEAADFFKEAALILEKLGNKEDVFDALFQHANLLAKIDTDATKATLTKLEVVASTSEHKVKVLQIKCEYFTFIGETNLLESTAKEGLELATSDIARGDFTFHFGHALWLQNRGEEAIPYLERALALRQEQLDWPSIAEITVTLGGVLFEVNRFAESEKMLEAAEHLYRDLGRDLELAKVLYELAYSQFKQGYPRKALEKLLVAETILQRTTGAGYDHADVVHFMSVCWASLAEENKFLNLTQQVLAMSARGHIGFSGALYLSLGNFYTRMGVFELAEQTLNQALHWPGLPAYHRPRALWGLARLYLLTDRNPNSLLAEVEYLLGQAGNPVADVCTFLCLKAQVVPAGEAIVIATRASELALSNGFKGEAVLSLTRSAQSLLRLEKPHEALDFIEQANDLLEETEFLRHQTEVLLTHYKVLKALGEDGASKKLEQTLAWLFEVANNKIPPEYRESFLTNNPVNKAILEEAKQAEVNLPQVS